MKAFKDHFAGRPASISVVSIAVLIPIYVVCLMIPLACTSSGPDAGSYERRIVANELPLRELWRWSLRRGMIYQQISDNGILVVGVSDWDRDKLMAFDLNTGNLIWKQSFDGSLRSLDVDDERVYLGQIRSVRAYDLRTGHFLWMGVRQSSYKKGGLLVYAKEDRLEVYDHDLSKEPSYQDVFILDIQTGDTLKTITYPFIFFRKGNVVYSRTRDGTLASDDKTGTPLWSLEHSWYVQRWPEIIADIVYLDVRDTKGSIYAVDTKTGVVYWHCQGEKGRNPDDTFTTKVAYAMVPI